MHHVPDLYSTPGPLRASNLLPLPLRREGSWDYVVGLDLSPGLGSAHRRPTGRGGRGRRRRAKPPCPVRPLLSFSPHRYACTLNPQPSTLNLPVTSQEKALQEFAQFAAKLKGDEKSEAQTFLFHLLAAFGHDPNTLPEGSTFEYRVRSSLQQPTSGAFLSPIPRSGEPPDVGGYGAVVELSRTKYADFVWPGRALIEMKSRGVKLSKHYQQTFDYWLNLVPHRPPYVVALQLRRVLDLRLQHPAQRAGGPRPRRRPARPPRRAQLPVPARLPAPLRP